MSPDAEAYNQRIVDALVIARDYSQIDGGHHKAWCIDQMVRALLPTGYAQFVRDFEEGGKYSWDEGIAP